MSNTLNGQMVEWNTIKWRKLEKVVYKLQKRIYQASLRGDIKAMRKLQKTLTNSWSAKALAVRKVTQDNKGKLTAGVDGKKSLTPKERIELVSNMKLNQVRPTRRVWIPKPGTKEKRPLGIPTMRDRANQALVKLALEPEWEARFEPNSFGFRPGRSAHDAIKAIHMNVPTQKFILDADIAKCFDKINHAQLLTKINTYPTLKRVLKAWLKAGVLDKGVFEETKSGTPQGGVISPLLANIALHGMEGIAERYALLNAGHTIRPSATTLIRYADDFVVIAPKMQHIIDIQQLLESWLSIMGLELSPSKTRVTHTREGFDFLGFNTRQYKAGKNYSSKNTKGKPLGHVTLNKPSQEAIHRHYDKISKVIESHKASTQKVLIGALNPIIVGWSNYYSIGASSKTFKTIDHLVFNKLAKWAMRRHPGKTWTWVKNKYWHTIEDNNWIFCQNIDGKISKLKMHSETKIIRHIKVRENASPFDGNLKYWSTRMGTNPMLSKRVTTLLKKQKGKCAICGLLFREEDVIEVDHIIPKHKKGKDAYINLQLLHRHCHDTKTANDQKIDFDLLEEW